MVRALLAGDAVGAVGAGAALQAGVPDSRQCAGAICRRGIMVPEERFSMAFCLVELFHQHRQSCDTEPEEEHDGDAEE